MATVQADLAANLPAFWVRLAELDYRIAVTTTGRDFTFDLATPFGISHGMQTGANGVFSMPAMCGLPKPWIDASDPQPALELMCAAAVGGAGPTFAMPFGAFRDALSKSNAGFHREGALVAVLIVSDSDDCSYEHSVMLPGGQSLCRDMMEPVATYRAFLDQLGPWAVAAIAVPDPAPRLTELATISDANLAIGLDRAAALFVTAAR